MHTRKYLLPTAEKFFYFIDLDERGEFKASVRKANDQVIYQIEGFDIFEDGWMKNKFDLKGLHTYLVVELGVMPRDSVMARGN